MLKAKHDPIADRERRRLLVAVALMTLGLGWADAGCFSPTSVRTMDGGPEASSGKDDAGNFPAPDAGAGVGSGGGGAPGGGDAREEASRTDSMGAAGGSMNTGGGMGGSLAGSGGAGTSSGATGRDGPGGSGPGGMGGSPGSGGSGASGGSTGTGGRSGTGGVMPGTGGQGTGGMPGSGGRQGTGGAGTGGAGTGGAGTGGARCPGRPTSATPSSVFDVTPSGGCGITCNVANAMATDGLWAGLDCSEPTVLKYLDGWPVTGCIAADFGAVVDLDPIIVRARAVPNACGQPCVDEYCHTGDRMLVYYGTERGTYLYAREITFTPSFVDYSITLNVPARYIVVCREGFGAARDDLAVDSIRTMNACN